MTRSGRIDDIGDEALQVQEFSRLLADLTPDQKRYKPTALAVAVSGGADSMALTLLTAQWARRRQVPFFALTVDHGLRRGSGAEAKRVSAALKEQGINHKILKWRGDKPDANIQAAARQARYDLMRTWCLKNKVPDLLLAHHQDDQAETVLMRLIRGSGVDGLAAMSGVRELDGVRLLRPLLTVPSTRLRATCRKFGQTWIDDPSNQNIAFDRIKVRKLLAEMKPLGLDAARLAQTARHMGRARETLEQQTRQLASSIVELNSSGVACIDMPAFNEMPEEAALRLLTMCLKTVGGGTYVPRFERLLRLHENLSSGAGEVRQTLAGCQIVCTGKRLNIFRENRNLPVMAIKSGQQLMWDRRFQIKFKSDGRTTRTGFVIAPLGAAGWKVVCDNKSNDVSQAELKSQFAPIPLSARYAMPGLWQKNRLLAQPWSDLRPISSEIVFSVTYSPQNWAKDESFPVVSPAKGLIY
jgi:tRNA(Ile)-lysidine synthase